MIFPLGRVLLSSKTLQSYRTISTSSYLLAGHSKWANIKHIKAEKDGEKSIMFQKYSKSLRLAIQEGGSSDPTKNSQLKSLIDEAIKNKMPMSTIQNTLKKYSDPTANKLIKFFVDIKLLGKVYMIVVLYTENVAGTRHALSAVLKKFSASYTECRAMFDQHGIITAAVPETHVKLDENALEEACTEDAIECGAEELEIVDFGGKIVNFICDAAEIERLKTKIAQRGYSVENSEHIFVPKRTVNLTEAEMQSIENIKSKIKAVEGVEEFYDNAEYPELEAS